MLHKMQKQTLLWIHKKNKITPSYP